MAKKTLRKGDNHKKKTRSKRGKRGGKPPTLPEIYNKYVRNIYRPAHRRWYNGRWSRGEINESDARSKKEEEKREERKREQEKRKEENYNNIFVKDTNKNIISDRVLYEMVKKSESERATDEKNIIDNGNFYHYTHLYERIDLGKVKGTGSPEDAVVRARGAQPSDYIKFCKDGKCDYAVVNDDRKFYYTLDKPIEKSVKRDGTQAPLNFDERVAERFENDEEYQKYKKILDTPNLVKNDWYYGIMKKAIEIRDRIIKEEKDKEEDKKFQEYLYRQDTADIERSISNAYKERQQLENAAEKEKETNQPGGKRRSRKKRNMKKSKKGKSKNRR
jgi:hypothetical protein